MGAVAWLTFTDRCNEITCFTRHVHRGKGREAGRDEQGCSAQSARITPRIQPSGEVLLCRSKDAVGSRALMCPCEEAVVAGVCGSFSCPKRVFVKYFWSQNMVRRFVLFLVLLYSRRMNYHMGVTMRTHTSQLTFSLRNCLCDHGSGRMHRLNFHRSMSIPCREMCNPSEAQSFTSTLS